LSTPTTSNADSTITADGNNNSNPSEKTEAEKEAIKAKREEAKYVRFLLLE
jgi:hypothetical protein